MQNVQLYVQGEKDVVGTIVFAQTDVITSNVMDFTVNPWVVGKTIVNNITGVKAIILSVVSSINIQLSITGFANGGSNFTIMADLQEVDLFKDETISLTQSIKNIKDIGKIQTNFTKSFTLPASKTNNKIFKHFYRGDVKDGFDARSLTRSRISLNGLDFQDGKMRLLGVKMKDNKPSSYKVSFVGNTVSLKTTFGDDEIADLPYLDVFNHVYSYSNVKTYATDGYNPIGGTAYSQPELIYPFISASKNRYYYNSGHSGEGDHDEIANVRNIYHDGVPSTTNNHSDFHSIQYFDLKPAIKVYYILKAIESKYGFTISDDFFRIAVTSSGKPNVDGLFNQLYMWCNREAGSFINQLESSSVQIKLSDLTLSSGTQQISSSSSSGDYLYSINSGRSGGAYTKRYYQYIATISPAQTGVPYDITVYDESKSNIYYEQKNVTNNQSISVYFIPVTAGSALTSRPIIEVRSSGVLTGVSLSNISIRYWTDNTKPSASPPAIISTGVYTTNSLTLGSGFNFRQDMLPKIKVIDFMTNLFKMFNLIAYFEGTELVVKTLDQYYLNSSHEEFDIDEYVDISSSNVDRSEVYNEINYEYKKANTILAINSNEATNDEYGNERFKSEEGNSFDGKKYDVKSSFGHMLFENLINEETSAFSDITWGWSVSQDESSVIDGGTFFLNNRKTLPDDIYITDKVVGEHGTNVDELGYLYCPSNVYTETGGTEVRSINFGSEYSILTNTEEEDGLFSTYHKNFILNIYDTNSRLVKITAHLPLKILLKYKLNDRFIVGNKKYLINSIKTNLQTGKSELELLTDKYGE